MVRQSNQWNKVPLLQIEAKLWGREYHSRKNKGKKITGMH